MKILSLFLVLTLLPLVAQAGSRGLDIAFLDATPSNTTKEGKRLAELLVMDMKELFASEKHAELFPWSEDKIVIKTHTADGAGISFDRLLNTKDGKKVVPFLDKHRVQDGLIVFYYDRANGFARLKLYDPQGKECLLLRLPLEGKSSAMKYSVMKMHRRGAVASIGAAVRWNP